MAFWNKKDEELVEEYIHVEMDLPTDYACRLSVLATTHGYQHKITVIDGESGTAHLGINLPKTKLDKVLSLCSSPVGSKFM